MTIYNREDSRAVLPQLEKKIAELEKLLEEKTEQDYIVEQGTSGIWTYRKWNSGIAECWVRYSTSQVVSTAWGAGYLSPVIHLNFITGFFVDVPSITFGLDGNYSATVFNSSGTTKDACYFHFFRTSNLTSAQTFNISIHAIGTWK